MKLKIEYKKREKLRNNFIVFLLTEASSYLMIYMYHILNKRYKSNDYVCLYNPKSVSSLSKDALSSVFNVVVSSQEELVPDMISSFLLSSPYRRVTFIGCECVYVNKQNQIVFTFPEELPRRSCNTFDLINANISYLTSSQRISANRAYQTCRHTFMYVNTGSKDSAARRLIKKKLEDNEKFKNVVKDNIDNISAIKRKICNFEMKTEIVKDHEALSKKIMKKFKEAPPLIECICSPEYSTIGSYGYQLSKKRDYSIVDKRISDQIKKNKSKH